MRETIRQQGLRFRGDWRVRAYEPIRIVDPQEAAAILRRIDVRAVVAETVPLSAMRQILALADRADRFARRQLERLLVGGGLKWADGFANLVVDAGVNHILDVGLSAGSQTATWYLGLTDGTPTVAAGDTMASHVGWSEVTAYDEAARQAFSDGGVSGKSLDNAASPATFTISANGTTVGGAFLTDTATKGGATGTLYAAGAFSAGDKSLDDNDTLDVTATYTGADDGA